MKKEIIRRYALSLRTEYKTYPEIISAIEKRFNVKISQRTLRRWWKKLSTTEWDLRGFVPAKIYFQYKRHRKHYELWGDICLGPTHH